MISVIDFVNKLSIGLKISLGIGLIIFIIGFQATLNLQLIEKSNNSFKNLEQLTKNNVSILLIDKNISELQKLVIQYGENGSDVTSEKMTRIFGEIKESLDQLNSIVIDSGNKKIIEDMRTLVKGYGENLESLKEQYQYRNKIIHEELPRLFEVGSNFLKENLPANSKNNNTYNEKFFQNIYLLWIEMKVGVIYYLDFKKYTDKVLVLEKVKKIKVLLNKNNELSDFKKDKIIGLLEDFEDYFDQAIQANRIYLSLVRIVMAGEVVEFATLAKLLRERKLNQLKEITLENSLSLENNKNFLMASLVLIFTLLILLSLFYNLNISRAIKNISSTFTKLLNGDFSEDIPGVMRGDEIGKLAIAANAFKNISKDLNLAKIEAEKLLKVKTEFLANMSHEIRTPLNGICGMVSHLKETEVSEEQVRMLDTVSSCSDDLLVILNDILDISKIEAGKIELEKLDFSVENCLKDLLYLFETLAFKKGIALEYKILNKNFPKYLIGDETRLKQILTNLISNAIKFTEKGGVYIEVKSSKLDNDTYKINFKVRDTGIGIDKNSKTKLFQIFQQADSSITRKYGGTGLGLAICESLAKLHESKIKLESKTGQGSQFSFDIIYPMGSSPKAAESISGDIKNTGKFRILLAEDNLVNIEVVSLILKKMGHDIQVAYNGEEAVNMVHKNIFDLVLMDMQMPIMDGVSATKIIKKEEKYKNLPIVALTANAFQEDKNKCLDAGMDFFLSKPFKKKDLNLILEKIEKAA